MNIALALKFAFKNIKANKILTVPFLISNAIMGILFYVMYSLSKMPYVHQRHSALPFFMQFAVVLIVIFSFIFMMYSNKIIMRKRNKELSLYGILGLEKRHIAKIVWVENVISFFIVTLFSIAGGHIFGKLAFLGIDALIKNYSANIMEYHFELEYASVTAIYLLLLFFVTYLINIVKISISTPMQLLSSQKKGEREPKIKWLHGIIGAICLSGGYYMALTTSGSLNSVGNFFIAVCLVIVGTYYLFISLSIFVLKLLKKNQKIFYKDVNFITISGMLYRMRANAIGLASIAILSTSIIITIASTFTIYSEMERLVHAFMPKAYETQIRGIELLGDQSEQILAKKEELQSLVFSNTKNQEKIVDFAIKEEMFLNLVETDGKLESRSNGSDFQNSAFFVFQILDTYNENNGTNFELNDHELYLSSNTKDILGKPDRSALILADQEYKIKRFEDSYTVDYDASYGIETHFILVKDLKALETLANYYTRFDPKLNRQRPQSMELIVNWNVQNEEDDYASRMEEMINARDLSFAQRANMEKDIYELNGGFLFLGIIIALLFLTGNILITYYKQISEGFDDREKYQIMKKVGLPNELIAKSTRRQILWIFFLPLFVAVIHCIFASKILYQLIQLFGLNSFGIFIQNFAITTAIFAVLYFIVFVITSRLYYKIVSR